MPCSATPVPPFGGLREEARLASGIVRDGTPADDGMSAYADVTYDELVALQHYIRDRAEAVLAAKEGGGS